MFRIRYLLQCNLRIQRFFRKMLESHNIRLDNMFRFWKAAEVEKMQQLQLTAVRSLGAVEQERGRPNWRTEYREFCVIDDVKRHVIHELYWERRQTWRRKRIKWQQQVCLLCDRLVVGRRAWFYIVDFSTTLRIMSERHMND